MKEKETTKGIVEAIEAKTEIARPEGKFRSQRETAKLGGKCQHIFDVKIVMARKERDTSRQLSSVDFPLRFCPFRSEHRLGIA